MSQSEDENVHYKEIPFSVVVTIVVVGGRGVVVEGSEQETLHTNNLEYF